MKKIFLSYRRAENLAAIGRIFDRLQADFGANSIFYDVETIPTGTDFADLIDQEVSKCSIMVAIIGKEWLARVPHLHNEADFVRIEISSALTRGVPVLPVLLDCDIPSPQILPGCLQRLPLMNGRKIDIGQDFHHHMNRLATSIRHHLSTGRAEELPPSDSSITSANQHIEPIVDMIQNFLENPGRISGITTGLQSLDKMIGGLPAGETMVVASQHGKDVSILGQNIVQHAAIDQAKKVFWVSTRERERSRVERMLRSRSGIPAADLKRGLLSRDQQRVLAEAIRGIQKASIELYSGFSATAGQTMSQLNQLSRDQTDLIVIDDLFSLDGFDTPGMFRKIVIAAKQREIPVLCLARVNKSQENAYDNPLESIDTGYEIMNEAAITAVLCRPYTRPWEDYENVSARRWDYMLRVVKSDFGGAGDIELLYYEDREIFLDKKAHYADQDDS